MNMTDNILHEIRTKKIVSGGSGISVYLIDDDQLTDTVRDDGSSTDYSPAIALTDGVSITSKTYLSVLGGTYGLSWTAYRYSTSGVTSLVGKALQEILVDGEVISSETVTYKQSGTSSVTEVKATVTVKPLQTITLRITPTGSAGYYLAHTKSYPGIPKLYGGVEDVNPYTYITKLD